MSRADRREQREHFQTSAERDIFRADYQLLRAAIVAYLEKNGVVELAGPLGQALQNALGASVTLREAETQGTSPSDVCAAIAADRERILEGILGAELLECGPHIQKHLETLRQIVHEIQPG